LKNKELWIFIFLVGLLGFSWPVLEIVHTWVDLYLFIFWALFIGIVALLSNISERQK
jgi:hypothetical protein